MEAKGTLRSLEDIQEYITNLRFKSTVVGGVDRSEALVSIREIYDSFSGLHSEALNRLEESEKRTKKQDEQIEKLRRELIAQENDLRRKIQQELSEEVERLIDERTIELREALKTQKEKTEKAEATQRELDKQATGLHEQVVELRGNLAESEHLRSQMEGNHQRELDLARVGAAAKGETLEEIYISAHEQREGIIAQAEQDAQKILNSAEAEAAEFMEQQNKALAEDRRKAEAQAAEIRRDAELTKQAGNKAVLEQENKCKQLQAQTQRNLENADAEVERRLEAAQVEAQRIVDSAKEGYKAECEKYRDQIVRLSTIRSKAVYDMQEAVSKLNKLAFELSGGSIKSDTEYLMGLQEAEQMVGQPAQSAAPANAQ